LDELLLRASIAEPCFSGKPADRAQHESPGFTSNDEPPVNLRALDYLLWGAELPVLPEDTTDQRTHAPRERQAVPALASSDPVEIGVEPRRHGTRKRGDDPQRVDTVS